MNALAAFALLTVKAPKEAARQILAHDWPREALWTAFLLSVVLSTMVHAIQNILFPQPAGAGLLQVPPGVFFVMILVLQAGFIAMLTTAGRWLGGQGNFVSLLALITWLQLLMEAFKAGIVALALLVPFLADLAVIAVNVMVFFILLHFVNSAHKFGSVWRSLGVVLMASALLLFALLFLVGLIGPANLGLPENV